MSHAVPKFSPRAIEQPLLLVISEHPAACIHQVHKLAGKARNRLIRVPLGLVVILQPAVHMLASIRTAKKN